MKDKYKGMTVNERLFLAGLIDDFYSAVDNKNIKSVVKILKCIELEDISIIEILESLKLTHEKGIDLSDYD